MSDTQTAFKKYISRRLKTLDGPDNLDPTGDNGDYRKLVNWLENRIIRELPIEGRAELSKCTGPIGKWKPSFTRYLTTLEAGPNVIGSLKSSEWRPQCLQFLLDLAVKIKYDDEKEEIEGTPAGVLSFDNVDPNSEDFKKGVTTLSNFLGVAVPSSFTPAQTFECCVSLLENRADNRGVPSDGFKLEAIDKVTAGFDTGDKTLNNIGRILRLLHLQNFRSFQTLINQSIVAVQEFTANPKTDQRLGQVGR